MDSTSRRPSGRFGQPRRSGQAAGALALAWVTGLVALGLPAEAPASAPAPAEPPASGPALPSAPAAGPSPVSGPRPSRELPVTPQLGRQSHNSPSLEVDPTEPNFVALASRLDSPDFSCQLHLSGNGGRSFVPANPVPKLPAGAEKCYAPEIAFDAEGRLYYLFVGLHTQGNTPMGVYLTTSSDRGRTFSTPRKVLGPNNFSVRMVIDRETGDRGRLHLVWIRASGDPGLGSFPPPPNPIVASFSDNGGRTFSDPVRVSDVIRLRVVAPAVAVGRDNKLHVLYYDLLEDARDYHGLEGPTWEGNWELVMATSTGGGGRFSRGVVVEDAVVPPERVMLIFTMPPASLAAIESGMLAVAWHDGRNGDWDVFFRRSDDGGRRWSEPSRLNDDERMNGRHQYMPRLSASRGGRLDAIFLDRRNDPENLRNDVFLTSSDDGGRTFSRNRKLTAYPSDSRVGTRYAGAAAAGLVEFGSRIGLLSKDGAAVAAWPDTRNAVRPAEQVIFSSVVGFGGSSGTSDRSLPSGLLLLLLAVLAVSALAVRRRKRSAGAQAGPEEAE